MLDFNPLNKFTLLSIDGGGMRGLLVLHMLDYLEQKTGKPLYDLFDMVAGTSTGAIIAAGIALRLSAKDLIEIYRHQIADSFNNGHGLFFWANWLMRGTRYLYDLQPFVDALQTFSQGKRLGDLGLPGTDNHPYRKPIVLFTTKDLRTGNTYYLVNEGPGAEMFSRWPVTGAVAASSAAPVYFPPVTGNLIDGGSGVFGNPCQAAAVELVSYIDVPPENVLHISIGTGHAPSNRAEGEGAHFSVLNWVPYLVSSAIEESALQQALTTRAIYPQMDFRRYNVSLLPHKLMNELNVTLGKTDPLSLGLDTTDPAKLDLMGAIGWAYAAALDWQKPNVMPWETPGGREKPVIKNVDWKGSIFV
ncbi:patatin-like phospholipase family protein [Phototrophicus methaneseepsis]|uniref:Patatin-like phospholipase family protein n=1 Tax=Phototrophicus methaneseepsis TaxID=2710758 RepID=A0A7S8EAX2_9CHLR|nr:patatin-like phospholipase family protein [Phototrophicus methaneseepsis]QPC83494.1 patatin-like phospholipase family protein [Phototrophicus methaneseepsis]